VVDGGSLAGGGAWLAVAVSVGVSIGPADGTVLSEIVGVGFGAELPDGEALPDLAVVDAEGLTAAARTAACGRLAHADGAAAAVRELSCPTEAPKTLELIVSSRKPAMPPTAAGRTTEDAFTSTPSPSWLRRPQDWCSPCPSQLCPSN
jgi:hypothetical protein